MKRENLYKSTGARWCMELGSQMGKDKYYITIFTLKLLLILEVHYIFL